MYLRLEGSEEMAGGNSGGCIGSIITICICAVAYVIGGALILWPLLLIDEDYGILVLFAWWIVLAACIIVIVTKLSNKKAKSNHNSSITAPEQNKEVFSSYNYTHNISVKNDYLNKLVFNNYIAKLNLKKKYENEIQNIETEQTKIKNIIIEKQHELINIKNGKGKSIFITQKKWLKTKAQDIEQIELIISENILKQEENNNRIYKIKEKTNKIYFYISDECNQELKSLKTAFERIKKSCYINGINDLRESSISDLVYNQDLMHIKFKTKPYGLELDKYRFYFFSHGIWVFEGEGELVGVYTPRAINSSFKTVEIPKNDNSVIYDDTKTITKNISYHSWLHKCKDGSRDRRYSHNLTIQHNQKQEYYIECILDIQLCGCLFEYEISSFENCNILKNAIHQYSKVKGKRNTIPDLLNLLEKCSSDKNLSEIQRYITENH